MKIGIDASRAFVKDPTGTERYSFEIITRILALPEAKKHTWILYLRNFEGRSWKLVLEGGYLDILKDQKIKKSKNQNLTSNVQFQNIPMKYLWTQVGLAWATWTDNLDCLWVPAHTLPALRKPGIRTVVTIHGIEYEWLPAYENLLQRWYLPLSTQYAVMSASRIIAVSQFTKNQLVERLGADEKKIEVVYEGCNTTLSDPPPNLGGGRQGVVLEKWGLKPKQYLLFVGTVQPRKNLERLIKVFVALRTKYPALKLVIAGKLGWNYEEVVELAKRYTITIVGYINETDRYTLLQNAIVYVQPSITEGFGLPVLEAMAAGVPVVSSNGGALSEVIGDAGLLFDPYDVKDMTEKLLVAICDHSLRLALIKKGKQRLAFFDWDLAAKRTYKILISNY